LTVSQVRQQFLRVLVDGVLCWKVLKHGGCITIEEIADFCDSISGGAIKVEAVEIDTPNSFAGTWYRGSLLRLAHLSSRTLLAILG
jgi:hypothetical protein